MGGRISRNNFAEEAHYTGQFDENSCKSARFSGLLKEDLLKSERSDSRQVVVLRKRQIPGPNSNTLIPGLLPT